jgi:glycosyltransferase involved in cell wall biosynthesis
MKKIFQSIRKYLSISLSVAGFRYLSLFNGIRKWNRQRLFKRRASISAIPSYLAPGEMRSMSVLPSQWSKDKQTILKAISPVQQALHARSVHDINRPLDQKALMACMDKALRASTSMRGSVVLSLSHDPYVGNVGGVQSVITTEAHALMQRGWAYIHLHPARLLSMLDTSLPSNDQRLVLTLNGDRQGVVRTSDMCTVLSAYDAPHFSPHLVIHHAMGFAPATLLALARVCRRSPVYFWTHDFFTLCVNHFLLRNNSAFCGAPHVESTACMVCNSGQVRHAHLAAMHEIFAALEPVVLAPSVTTLNFWRSRGELRHVTARVVPPAVLSFENEPVERAPGPLRIAFVGPPAAHKGWATFAALVACHADDSRYQFVRLGVGESPMKGLDEIEVQVTADHPNAMVDALRDQRIDVVINWYPCFETFSFVTHEAMAAGVFIVTRYTAGHVWPAIAATPGHRGLALHNEAELREVFLSNELIELASRPRTRGQFHRTSGTADLLLAEI